MYEHVCVAFKVINLLAEIVKLELARYLAAVGCGEHVELDDGVLSEVDEASSDDGLATGSEACSLQKSKLPNQNFSLCVAGEKVIGVL